MAKKKKPASKTKVRIVKKPVKKKVKPASPKKSAAAKKKKGPPSAVKRFGRMKPAKSSPVPKTKAAQASAPKTSKKIEGDPKANRRLKSFTPKQEAALIKKMIKEEAAARNALNAKIPKPPIALPPVKRNVYGNDDRGRVDADSLRDFPYRSICSLRIQFPHARKIGTGWFAGPRLVMTAGHCTFDNRYGGKALSIEVIPGRDGATYPASQSRISNTFYTHTGWSQGGDKRYDYGAVYIDSGSAWGTELGCFTIRDPAIGDADLDHEAIISGYPAHDGEYPKPQGTQWWDSGKLENYNDFGLYYRIDTTEGNSGSPVWMNIDGQAVAIGVHNSHTTENGDNNFAARINEDVLKHIRWWNYDSNR